MQFIFYTKISARRSCRTGQEFCTASAPCQYQTQFVHKENQRVNLLCGGACASLKDIGELPEMCSLWSDMEFSEWSCGSQCVLTAAMDAQLDNGTSDICELSQSAHVSCGVPGYTDQLQLLIFWRSIVRIPRLRMEGTHSHRLTLLQVSERRIQIMWECQSTKKRINPSYAEL